MNTPEPPARVTLPRALAYAMACLLIADVLDGVWKPLAMTVRVAAVLFMINERYSSWRWARYAARKLEEDRS